VQLSQVVLPSFNLTLNHPIELNKAISMKRLDDAYPENGPRSCREGAETPTGSQSNSHAFVSLKRTSTP